MDNCSRSDTGIRATGIAFMYRFIYRCILYEGLVWLQIAAAARIKNRCCYYSWQRDGLRGADGDDDDDGLHGADGDDGLDDADGERERGCGGGRR